MIARQHSGSQHRATPSRGNRPGLALGLVVALSLAAGCQRVHWRAPHLARPLLPHKASRQLEQQWASDESAPAWAWLSLLDQPLDARQQRVLAEYFYSAGRRAEHHRCERAVDLYYGATLCCWRLCTDPQVACDEQASSRAVELYRGSLTRLIDSAQKFGRLDPATGLTVELAAGRQTVPVAVHSRVWGSCEVGRLVPVGCYQDRALSVHYQQHGVGVALVAQRRAGTENDLGPAGQAFALTAVLCESPQLETLSDESGEPAPDCARVTLELIDPFCESTIDIAGRPRPLEADITAPLVAMHKAADYSPFREFVRPDTQVRLTATTPHERGKIPVLFVHGLLSDPMTYLDLANTIRADAELNQRYEIWSFRYPTGGAVLQSAAQLRQRLAAAVALYADDPAMSQIVIVGHSMGGLLSKLQVTESGNTLWNEFSDHSFDEVRAPPQVLAQMRGGLFFQPSPAVKRVIYIATPHGGSPWANRLVGRLASQCVLLPAAIENQWGAIVDDNEHLLKPNAPRRPPTSLDLLRPDSSVLHGISKLCYAPWVTTHSIVGTGHRLCHAGPADGVVPVTSTYDPHSVSECHVDATHTRILRKPETYQELKRILLEHLESVDADAMRAGTVARRLPAAER